ncbi:MAG: alpha/beta fold hydrolase [FCB group bacterium]|nr:alpha/beta fold hydrolase [FCB group bacterium]
MDETCFRLNEGVFYFRHNFIDPEKPALLFIHGLGDSGLSFERVFQDRRFDDFNLLVPDLLGYGRSSGADKDEDYSFASHLERIWRVIDYWNLKEVTVIGHSMGGDICTLLCESDENGIIKGLVNIEGAITQHDLFISSKAAKAVKDGVFDNWYEDFVYKKVFRAYTKVQSGRDYYASIRFCRPEAFKINAVEIVERNTNLPGKFKSSVGETICSLKIPKVFCYGTESLKKQTLEYLELKGLNAKAMPGSGHCPMTDKADEFYGFLSEFVSSAFPDSAK